MQAAPRMRSASGGCCFLRTRATRGVSAHSRRGIRGPSQHLLWYLAVLHTSLKGYSIAGQNSHMDFADSLDMEFLKQAESVYI